MATGVKAHRPSRLTEDETLTSFEDWKNNSIFYLSQEASFKPFLKSDAAWKKTSEAVDHRGLADATQLQSLNNFLGVIASLAPPLLHGDIIDDTTNLSDVFILIRNYYQFAPSESTFLKFSSIKREVTNGSLERPVHLYLRMRMFILLIAGGKIHHNGKVPTTNETFSPTVERLIVLRWLELLHPALPDHVAKVFSHELRSKSLKDLYPQIVEQVDDLIRQVDNAGHKDTEASLLYTKFASRRIPTNMNRKQHSKFGQFNSRKFNSSSTKPNFKQNSFTNQSIKKCSACKSVGEPFIGHSVHNCPNISANDQPDMLKTFALDIDEGDVESDNSDNQEEDIDVPCIMVNEGDVERIESNRVRITESPKVNVKILKSVVTMIVDTGATGSMMTLELCNAIGLKIYPSPHSAIQADGESRLNVVGEVHTSITSLNGITMTLSAIVVTKLKVGLIIGTGFLKEHGIVIDFPRNMLILPGNRVIEFNDQVGSPKVSLLRIDVNRVVFPGETVKLPTPAPFLHDQEMAIEPRMENIPWYKPFITRKEDGITIENELDTPVTIKKGQLVGQVRSVSNPNLDVASMMSSIPNVSSTEAPKTTSFTKSITIDPDGMLSPDDVTAFRQINEKFDDVFNPEFGAYNGKSGNVTASVYIGKTVPTPKKGKVPSYNRKDLQTLQEKFDELEQQGVLIRPESNDVKVIHSSPSFLVKKPDKSHRLVTSFTELNKFVRPLPSKLSTTSEVLKSLSRWKYIIKTDLKSAYYQIKVDKDSQKWLGTNSPYKGMYVYCRGAMGLRNMAEFLEEVVSRVLGDCLARGILTKVADDLVIGGNTISELKVNWNTVLQKLADNNLTISPSKTFICPKSIKIIGWNWQGGSISVDTHRINPLITCTFPDTVKQLRSFIGAFRAISVCIPKYGTYLNPLENVVAGKESKESITWTEELRKCFTDAQKALRAPRTIQLPHPTDQLILISDGCNSPASVGGTLYVKRGENLKTAGFFSAKLAKYQLLWLPCEVEALGINLVIKAFSEYIRESHNTTKFLTDSKPCVQAFEKLSQGGFSLSPRLSSFLMNLNAHNVSISHVKGSQIKLTDFASRNPITCLDGSCQVCYL